MFSCRHTIPFVNSQFEKIYTNIDGCFEWRINFGVIISSVKAQGYERDGNHNLNVSCQTPLESEETRTTSDSDHTFWFFDSRLNCTEMIIFMINPLIACALVDTPICIIWGAR